MPLMQATRMGYPKIVARLLEARANPNQVSDENGSTPILEAATLGGSYFDDIYPNIIKILLHAQADITLESSRGTNALSQAAFCGTQRIIELLVNEAGADLYHKNSQQKTALLFAAEERQRETVQFIIYDLITTLDSNTKEVIKTWLCVTKKMQLKHGLSLPKDIRKLIAQEICLALAQELHSRIIRAGGMEALAHAQKNNVHKIEKDLKRFLDMNYLIKRVQTQVGLPKSNPSQKTLEKNNDAVEASKKLKLEVENESE